MRIVKRAFPGIQLARLKGHAVIIVFKITVRAWRIVDS